MQIKYNILYIVLLLFVSSSTIIAQADAYTGTWHYVDGNELFIVSLWQDNDGSFSGYYKKVEYSNGIQGNVIFNSRIIYNNGIIYPPTIYGKLSGNGISGIISDNTIEGYVDDSKFGILYLEINNTCNNCPYTAIWKVSERPGLRVGFVPGFSVPTDVILTKVSNTVDLN